MILRNVAGTCRVRGRVGVRFLLPDDFVVGMGMIRKLVAPVFPPAPHALGTHLPFIVDRQLRHKLIITRRGHSLEAGILQLRSTCQSHA